MRNEEIFCINKPRFIVASSSSDSGKTLISCAIMNILKEEGFNVRSFKCGPDFIDPMFHSVVTGEKGVNLDSYFCEHDTLLSLFAEKMLNRDIAVIEGAMGYYDGMSVDSVRASSHDIARITKTPCILVVDCSRMGQSVVALIKGFCLYKKENCIKAVILNKVSEMLYEKLKDSIQRECGIKVLGFMPKTDSLVWEKRHLGLLLPDEIKDVKTQIEGASRLLKNSLDISSLLEIAKSSQEVLCKGQNIYFEKKYPVKIALALDEAFCFYYEDNIEILKKFGAEVVYFSPLHDSSLPAADGFIFGGGYPELFLRELEYNGSMRRSVLDAFNAGSPMLAECGGFLYLQQYIEDENGSPYKMVGAIEGSSKNTGHLVRFGYAEFSDNREPNLKIKGHEFHYYDSTNNGEEFKAVKPISKKTWNCIVKEKNALLGFPHLYYYSCPHFIEGFLTLCQNRRHE